MRAESGVTGEVASADEGVGLRVDFMGLGTGDGPR